MKIKRKNYYILCGTIAIVILLVMNIKVADKPSVDMYGMEEMVGTEIRSQFGFREVKYDVECEITGVLWEGEIQILLLDGGFVFWQNYREDNIISEWTISEKGEFDLLVDIGNVTCASDKTIVVIGSQDLNVTQFKMEKRSKSKLIDLLIFGR